MKAAVNDDDAAADQRSTLNTRRRPSIGLRAPCLTGSSASVFCCCVCNTADCVPVCYATSWPVLAATTIYVIVLCMCVTAATCMLATLRATLTADC